jgi:hypothetical protein
MSEIMDEYFESRRLRQADHRPYSADLEPSGLFLFGFIKGQLRGTYFPDGIALICEVREVL